MTETRVSISSRVVLMRALVATGLLLSIPTSASPTGSWLVSDAGTGPWERINGSCMHESELRGGDFDRDGRTDVFNARGGKWFISFGGRSKWKRVNSSKIDASQLRFGDFDGDGRTDVFNARGGKWFISFGGKSKWERVNSSKIPLEELRFGDFNNDSKTDVFAKWDGKWRMSSGATKRWRVIKASNPGVPDLGVRDLLSGNYIGDNRKDAFVSDRSGCSSGCGGHRQSACLDGRECKPGLTKADNTCYSCGIKDLACCTSPRFPQGSGFCYKGRCQPPGSTSFTCQ